MSETSEGLLAGRFALEHEVGRGGFAVLYRAIDSKASSQPARVALKVMLPSAEEAAGIKLENAKEQFAFEAHALSKLHHACIARLVASGVADDGRPFIATEWVDGETLQQRQMRAPGTFTLGEVLDVGSQVASALDRVHAAGVVHRDVTPSNVMVVARANAGAHERIAETIGVKLIDFGVATCTDSPFVVNGNHFRVGTPSFMAPEQVRGDSDIDARADLYGLGATLFAILAGRPPHVGPTAVAVLARVATTPAPRLRELVPDAPLALDELLAEMLAIAPSERPASAWNVHQRLRAIRDDLDSPAPTSSSRGSASTIAAAAQVLSTARPGGVRLVTTIVATAVPGDGQRGRFVAHLRAGGAEVTELGKDAIVAHFGVKVAMGDEASRALQMALELAKAGCRVGVATGRTRIEGARPTGEVVDRAAGLARDARNASVLSDRTTGELTRGQFDTLDCGDGALAVRAHAPIVNEPRDERLRLFGRDAELSQILSAFERCEEDKTPIACTLTGVPGIGKTALRREALARMTAHRSSPELLISRAEPFAARHALGVMADVTRAMMGIRKGTRIDDARRLLIEQIRRNRLTVTTAHDLVARLIADEPLPDAGEVRDALWLALTDLVMWAASEKPVVISVEDAQWADRESLLWLDHLLARSAGLSVFLIATVRPALWRDESAWLTGRDHVRIELRPLARRMVRAIASDILGNDPSLPDAETLIASIVAQAGGSPLFAEELARLAQQGRGSANAPTIEAAIQVSLDALDERVRPVATMASVFGVELWKEGLVALGMDESSLALPALVDAGIIVPQPQPRFSGTAAWTFKHSLTRDVAYASLSDDERRSLHALAGRWLAKQGEDDAIVARHLELGGELEQSASYMERAARRALAASALSEAVRLSETGLAFAEDKPTQFSCAQILDEAWSRLDAGAGERETAVRAMYDATYDEASVVRAFGARVRYEDACGGKPETTAGLEEVIARAKAVGLVDEEARSAAALAARFAFAGELDKAGDVAGSLLTLAQRHGVESAAVDAWQTLAVVRQARGRLGTALEARRSAARAAAAAGLRTREATLTINVGFALTTMGARDLARNAIEEGIALAQALGSQGTERHGQMNLLGWAATFGADSSHQALLAQPRALADSVLSGGWVAHDRATLGVLFYRGLEFLRSNENGGAASPDVMLALAGRHRTAAERARTLLQAAASGYRATKMLDVVPAALGAWAEAERRCGMPTRALELATEGVALLESGSPSLLNEAPVYLALHDACIDLGLVAEAKSAIERAIPRLVNRVEGLGGAVSEKAFLTEIQSNANLVTRAATYRCLPEALSALVAVV